MKANYLLEDDGSLIIENYNWAKPFSNYFPGIAGETGVPTWIFYVNRAQAVCSFGVHDKDHAIMPFQSFNTACQIVGQQGFRTYIKQDGRFYEPFRKTGDPNINQRMTVSSSELELHEKNHLIGLDFEICYFPLPENPIPGLVRRLTIRNSSKKDINLELLDGLSRILPYGVTFEHYKVTTRHIEAMMGVSFIDGIPVFKLKQTPQDIEKIGMLEAGHFYVNQIYSDNIQLHKTVVDPAILFGDIETSDHPWLFMHGGMEAIIKAAQVTDSRTPCAFTALEAPIAAGEVIILDTIIGQCNQPDQLSAFLPRLRTPGFINEQRRNNKDIIRCIKNTAFTVSSKRVLDEYTQQTFLENVMRGGMPIALDYQNGKTIFYLYNRQNGDLERDYHWFILEPTYLSQGNSHYRNILQNRRVDTWFFPFVKDHNLIQFMNLIQLDGYNPLEVKSVRYRIDDSNAVRAFFRDITGSSKDSDEWMDWISQPFTPGEFIMKLDQSNSNQFKHWRDILAGLLPLCIKEEIGSLHEGYWIDHWFYNLDLLESILSIFPDRVHEFLIDYQDYTFFDNPDVVQPRSEKSIQVDGKVRQYKPVVRDHHKSDFMKTRAQEKHRVRTQQGQGDIYHTNLLVKWLCIIANKLASLDPAFIGVEMEAGKPGWCDSLNGLPGLFGSSICETLELIRACRLIRNCLEKSNLTSNATINIYNELSFFMQGIEKTLMQDNLFNPTISLMVWDNLHKLREQYLQKICFGIKGNEDPWSLSSIQGFLDISLIRLEAVFKERDNSKLFDPSGVPYTYFINQRIITPSGEITTASNQVAITPFLEGPVHFLRVYPDQAKEIYDAVKNSELYDLLLKMYRCCCSLENEPFEIGRIQAYPQGWLENASIYTHMEYKWILEVLKSELFEEFFDDMLNVLIPFHEPEKYGRSVIENCSFIVSSAFTDQSLHGQAFQPRLSGMTCEYLHIWTLMTSGQQPFKLDDQNQLQFGLQPILPGWLFTEKREIRKYWDENQGWKEISIDENQFAFKFMNKVLVVYNNPKRVNTFGEGACKVKQYKLYPISGEPSVIKGQILSRDFAEHVRLGKIYRMDVELAL